MKRIIPIFLMLIIVILLSSCSTQESVNLGYMQNSKIVPSSRILVLPFQTGNKYLEENLTQDFIYYLIKRNKFNVSSYDKDIEENMSNIKNLKDKYDYVIFTKVLRYDIKEFRPIFSVDMTIYNTFDSSIAWKLRYDFYWNDSQTERFVSEAFGKDYDFNKFYDSKNSIKEFAKIILEAISYKISKLH